MKQNRDQTQSSAQAGANKCPDPRPLNGSQESARCRATGCRDHHLLRLIYSVNCSVTPGPAISCARDALQGAVNGDDMVVREDQRGKAELEFSNSLQVTRSPVDLHFTLDLAVSGDDNLVALDYGIECFQVEA